MFGLNNHEFIDAIFKNIAIKKRLILSTFIKNHTSKKMKEKNLII
jgi:hypothetical protein